MRKHRRASTCSAGWLMGACVGLLAAALATPAPAQLVPADPAVRGPASADRRPQALEEMGPDRLSVLVHLAPGADRGPVRDFAFRNGGVVRYEYDILPDVINVRGIPARALEELLDTPGVVRWEEDRIVRAHMNDSMPLIRGLQSQITGAGFTADGAGARVCVLDTGIDSDSAMYSSRIDSAAGRDFVNNDNNPEDDNGHGSHVAGTAVGGTGLTVDFGCNGPEPFQGVAPEATLVGVKVLDAGGSGLASDIIAGINYAADQSASGGQCDVINMSLGGGQFTGTCDGDSLAAASNNAVGNGVVVVASSGNDDFANAMGTPACGSQVIAVGAAYDDPYPNCEFPSQTGFTFCTCVFITCCGTCTDNGPSQDQIGCYSNESDELDVSAPGCIIFSADSSASPNGIVGFCGTSQASPHVAGLAALLVGEDPSLTPAQVRQMIRDGAVDLGAPGFDRSYGHGRIDVLDTLALLGPGCQTDPDCDDSDACTADTCNAGSCSNTPISCDDGDACTADSCDPVTGCDNAPISCDDGSVCTVDSCDPVTGCDNAPISCDDGNACTADSCDPVTGCDNAPISCDDGSVCTVDSCDPVTGCDNAPISCDDGSVCTVDSCDPVTGCDNAPISCDDGDLCTVDSCDPVTGCANDPVVCPNPGDVCNPTTGQCEPPSACDNDGVCEAGEDCNNCSNDCISGTSSGASCGNGICEAGNGEDCLICPADCNGKQNGKPSGRFCCGDGDGEGPLPCSDALCSTGGFQCTDTPAVGGPFCCGDGICEGDEDSVNCLIDCPAPFCGDGTCDPGEDQCGCPSDCGSPPATETNCSNGVDDDCDGFVDGADTDCQGVCGQKNDPCSSGLDCCSGVCKSNGRCR